MASLTPKEQEEMLYPLNYKCRRCGKVPIKNYCRECDEFFNVCDCPPEPNSRDDHRGHRTY